MLKFNVMVNSTYLEDLKAVMSRYGVNNNNSCICTDVYNTVAKDTIFITVYCDDMVYWNWSAVLECIESVKSVRAWVISDDEYISVGSFNCSMWYNMVKAGCEFGLKSCIVVKNNNPLKPLY